MFQLVGHIVAATTEVAFLLSATSDRPTCRLQISQSRQHGAHRQNFATYAAAQVCSSRSSNIWLSSELIRLKSVLNRKLN
eukprot:scaffold132107_cov20-Prasinocladus_malaysianus.AAC.1